jgi:hypothetical protein
MMKKVLAIASVIFLGSLSWAQEAIDASYDKYPVFPECSDQEFAALPSCFNTTLQDFVYANFQVPAIVSEEAYKGNIVVLFEVDALGNFKVLYVEAAYQALKNAVKVTFSKLPKIAPATQNGTATYVQFSMPIAIPLVAPNSMQSPSEEESTANLLEKAAQEYDQIKTNSFQPNSEYSSQLSVPFSHQNYAVFDANMNALGNNAHTAQKPYLYQEVSSYYNFEEENKRLSKNKSSWWGRKFWDEHVVTFQEDKYWFTADIVADLQLGKDLDSELSYTYNNTRALNIQGGLGKKINFWTTIYESQGRFADYINEYARSIRPDGGNPGIVPGRGIGKDFKGDAFDYPIAEGYVSYSPDNFFNIQLGHGKNFIGDGYRSLLLSDVASPHPYLKLNTTFWKIKYTNTWTSLRDVRPEATVDGAFATKFMANHYLSWNVTKRFNLGFFESVLWDRSNDRGFDFNYLNPIIFYRAIEFSTGSRAGNALIGLSGKFKLNNTVNVYSQLIIDEFSSSDIFGGNKSWKNKLGYQLGVKYYNAFGLDKLGLQLEYNQVRPYTYSHDELLLNYSHNNQPMAHLWGANFRELIGIAHYRKDRWFGMAKVIYGQRGLDIDDGVSDAINYGSDVLFDNDNRPSDDGILLFQGNKTNVFIADLQAGYLVNPTTNLKVYANITYRKFDPTISTNTLSKTSTTWFNIGFRTDLFNWYFDL